MTTPKVGPLTQAELQQIWESTSDPGFWQPLEQAGEGNGFEAYTQAWAQHARVSQAVDVSTQAMFVLPWSGQTNPPAAGPQKATVTLTLKRTGDPSLPLVLAAGNFVDEVISDWSYSGSTSVKTGRRYALSSNAVFVPGQTGPIQVVATAERPGYGYNNPQPGTLTDVEQVGTQYSNTGATVRLLNYPSPSISPQVVEQVFVDCADRADSFLPDHVGQYIEFTAGSNTGTIARVVSYSPPNLTALVPTGGTLGLALEQAVRSNSGHVTGTFVIGEQLTFKDHTAAITGYGTLLGTFVGGAGETNFLILKVNGKISTTVADLGVATITGSKSGAIAIVDFALSDVEFVAETGTAAWRILDWIADWGVTSTNVASPSGGTSGMLDALGKERAIYRRTGEADGPYRQRVAAIADVVSPNAILRAINRVAVPAGFATTYQFLEAGTTYRGFYFDQDFYDYDAVYPTGAPSTAKFFPGEKVIQLSTPGGFSPPEGSVAVGRALVDSNGHLVAIGAVWGTFQGTGTIVGLSSGATLAAGAFPYFNGGLRAADEFKVIFSYEDMRAWFYVVLPPQVLGDYGFAYDIDSGTALGSNAYDVPFVPPNGSDGKTQTANFYDGAPLQDAGTYRQLWNNLDGVRAGGVGVTFQLAGT